MSPARRSTHPRSRRWRFRRRALPLLSLGAGLLLGGCALYHARPLPEEPDLQSHLPSRVAAPEHAIPGVEGPQAESTAQPLGLSQVAALAVVQNPQLRAVRSQAGISKAQVFAAGLLPDPVVGVSGASTVTSGMGLTNPWMIDVSQDLSALLTRWVRLDSKRAALKQTRLHILWEEWQTAQAARLLAVEVAMDRQRLSLLQRVRDLFQRRYERSFQAYQRGNLTLETTGADLTALLSANTRVNDLQRKLDQARHRLDAVLGLEPDVPLPLVSLGSPDAVPQAEIATALKQLPKHRPDLLALRAGYASQEATVRQAILEQFPAITIGGEHSRDNSNVFEWGLSINISLPLFNRNRGAIAIQRATRAELAASYQARLDAAQSEVAILASRQQMLDGQVKNLRKNLPELERMADLAENAYRAGNINALSYLNLQNTLLDKQLELIDLMQSQWDTRIGLDTLLARTAAQASGTGTSAPAATAKGKKP